MSNNLLFEEENKNKNNQEINFLSSANSSKNTDKIIEGGLIFHIPIEKIKKEMDEKNDKIINELNNIKKFSYKDKINNLCLSNCIKEIKDNIPEIEMCSKLANDSLNKNNQTTKNIDTANKENESYSLNDSSLYRIKENSMASESNEKKAKEFNSLRLNFYLKNNLYDVPLISETNSLFPEKYKINENYSGFLYPNELKTYCITKSGFISNNNKNNYLEHKGYYYHELGLYFCGKEINYGNIIEKRRCKPDDFMCKNCMELNKEMYHIKKKYLININGRVAKLNKGSYHCFGHFLCGEQIEDCITKFTCEACKILDNLTKNYYF
jgi:hypothetical protein